MGETFNAIASIVATAIEAIMVLVLMLGVGQALLALLGLVATRTSFGPAVRNIWLHFAAWILLALEFALAADLIRTVIAPSWDEVGKLAVIAAIRTVLGWFLGRDIAEFTRAGQEAPR
jgi:uncharacterized membrane protein